MTPVPNHPIMNLERPWTHSAGRDAQPEPPVEVLSRLLRELSGVRQSPRFHPEGDALYHSLQAFCVARRKTRDKLMWATALLHDVGKAYGAAEHDEVGADLLDGVVQPRIVWLVRHHLDLLRDPRGTRRAPMSAEDYAALVLLRRCDLDGRDPQARVPEVEEALDLILDGSNLVLCGVRRDEHEQERMV